MGPLLPARARGWGLALVLVAMGLAVARVRFGLRPACLELPVFAIYSQYFEARAFTHFTKNVTDEVCLLTAMAGLALLVFSEVPGEDPALRGWAWGRAALLNGVLLALSVLFVHGVAFAYVLAANALTLPVLFLAIFHLERRRRA